MKVSLNETVRVKLTQAGLEFLENEGYSYEIKNGYITTHLWDLMETFGSKCGMLSLHVFEQNMIEFLDVPVKNEDLNKKVESLERRIDTVSETLSIQNHSLSTQANTINTMRTTIDTQCKTLKILSEILESLQNEKNV